MKVYRYTHPCADCPKEILRTAIRCRECYFALRRSQPRSRVAIHGPMYAAWKQMRQRCNNPKCSRYKWYGARGIKVCVRWNSFDLFLKDMGPRPTPKHSVERRKNHLGYTPGNCYWATIVEQRNNMRSNHLLTFKGETLNLREWATRTGLSAGTLRSRVYKGWTAEKILTRPMGRHV